MFVCDVRQPEKGRFMTITPSLSLSRTHTHKHTHTRTHAHRRLWGQRGCTLSSTSHVIMQCCSQQYSELLFYESFLLQVEGRWSTLSSCSSLCLSFLLFFYIISSFSTLISSMMVCRVLQTGPLAQTAPKRASGKWECARGPTWINLTKTCTGHIAYF